MAVVFTDAAEVIALKNFVNNSAPESLVLRLYSNNITPNKLDVVGDYTEVSGNGYSEVTLDPTQFSFNTGDPSSAAYPQITFLFTGNAGNVYGYFVVRAVTGDLIFSNRFSNAPISIANNGDEIRVTLSITLNNP
tara:strand:- start:85 stop:489 length:405 start_codon:yes stop_codon:yes gene_type:complete